MFSKELNALRKNKEAQRIIELAVNSVLAILLIGLSIPSVNSILTLRDSTTEVTILRDQLAEKRQGLIDAETEVKELNATRDTLLEAMPLVPRQFDLLNQVKTLAESRGLVVDQLVHRASDTNEVEFSIIGLGRYDQIVSFIDSLEQLPRMLQTTDISISESSTTASDNPDLVFTITGHAFYYPNEVTLLED